MSLSIEHGDQMYTSLYYIQAGQQKILLFFSNIVKDTTNPVQILFVLLLTHQPSSLIFPQKI